MKQTALKIINRFNSARDRVYNKIQSPVVVLMYHRVLEENKNNSSLTVTSENFQNQISYLRENFNILKFDSDWGKVKTPSFVITFDDGYYDNYLIAKNFLVKKNIPSTFFITTKNLNTNNLFWWDEVSLNRNFYSQLGGLTYDELIRKLIRSTPEQQTQFLSQYRDSYKYDDTEDLLNYRSMTYQELYELSQFEQVTIGAHTINHTRLPLLNKKEIFFELSESKKTIEGIIGEKVLTGSFPYGSYNRNTINACRDAGLTKAATTVSKNCYSWTKPLMIPRVQVLDDSIDDFIVKIDQLIR